MYYRASSSIIVLSPLFNLVRVLHMLRYEGSLEIINALLGCAIVLPTFFDDENIDQIFFDYDKEIQKKILDIYFHCANWLRETVSSFATQREPMIRQKVLQRLADLISIESKIRQLLSKAPSDYAPPQSEFVTGILPSSKQANKTRSVGGASSGHKPLNRSKAIPNDTETMNLNESNPNETTRVDDITKLGGANKMKICVKSNFENLYGSKEIYRFVIIMYYCCVLICGLYF